ncbi:hypothetical protein [Tardiphaga sp.]|uniref:hypothetical protein n=1 Tax=Tardiphaga sp. TaxID=1926292 RepID=UPI002610687F|nr:hypothetical protein [Tardiphaga sp.]MDB5617324.1 hypothetical protein [Tardiphaga sp.]
MSRAFVIEARSIDAGIVVLDGRYYRFFAASHEFNGLEARDFRSPLEAQRAVEARIADLGHRRPVTAS